MASKERLDVLLVQNGHFSSREQAHRSIMAGEVFADGQRATKPGSRFAEEVKLEVKGDKIPFVSRGGLKLAKALQEFSIPVPGRTALDIGASTGGFTDCLLQNGAIHVHAVDVGYGQLAWSLRQDERVTVMERTNARYLQPGDVPVVEIITIDVSFISLSKILPTAVQFLTETGDLITLVKPQFEAGPKEVGKRGVVRDAQVHQQVLENVLTTAEENALQVLGVSFSPVTGPQGNIEFLAHLGLRPPENGYSWREAVVRVVEEAHKELR